MEYIAKYDSELLRGIDDKQAPRPWDLQKRLIELASKDKNLLDIGCGTAFKLIPLVNFFNAIHAIDPSQSMLNAATQNILTHHINNIFLQEGKGENLPFENNSFDVVSCMLSRWEVSEIHRVLKSNGDVIVEHIGCEDKKKFKELFGKDENGWRGQFINYSTNDYIKMYQELFEKYFNHVTIINGYWNTHYSLQGIEELLKYTPSIRNYNEQKDAGAVKQAYQLFKTQSGITLQQNRILIHAKSPRKH